MLNNLHTRPSLLGRQAVHSLESAKGLYFSPITFFEWLQKDDYLGTTAKKLAAATLTSGIEELPLSARAALEAQRFGSLRGSDPLDFLLLYQAAEAEMDFYTSDRRLLNLGLDFVKDSTK